jgi:hypothetical protein
MVEEFLTRRLPRCRVRLPGRRSNAGRIASELAWWRAIQVEQCTDHPSTLASIANRWIIDG